MNYLVMDRASEAAANDLAEVRKLIEGMNALVNSQIQQQQQQAQLQAQQQQQQQQLHSPYSEYPTHDQQQQEAALMAATLATVTEHQQYLNMGPPTPPSLQQTTNPHVDSSQQRQSKSVNDETPQEPPKKQPSTTAATKPAKAKKASKNTTSSPATQSETAESPAASTAPAADTPATTSAPSPQAGVIVEVIHLTFNRVLYFQLAQDATIEPMIAWLRLSYQDAAISGMVLQYKGFDGLWKCLLNRDDSLRRILKQSMKGNTMLQMRVPREQDLLSSGYTDRRLLALTKTECM